MGEGSIVSDLMKRGRDFSKFVSQEKSFDRNYLKMHSRLISNTVRTGLYRKAILKTVRRGDVVMDIGTGSGILTLFACQAGAKRVYAIERTEAVALAEALIQANGFGDRVLFIKKDVRGVHLKEKVDVIISELFGILGIGQQNILQISATAKKRFLKKQGKMIPSTLESYLVPVEDREFYNHILYAPLRSQYQADFSCFRRMALNNLYKGRFRRKSFLGPPQKIHTIHFAKDEYTDTLRANLSFSVRRKGTFHGFCGYFRASLSPGVTLTTEPSSIHWVVAFLPAEEPVSLRAGDRIDLEFVAVEFEKDMLCRWKTSILASKIKRPLKAFDQNTFSGFPVTSEGLWESSKEYRPRVSKEGQRTLFMLGLCQEGRTIEEIAEAVHRKFPELDGGMEEASRSVTHLLGTYHLNGLLERPRRRHN